MAKPQKTGKHKNQQRKPRNKKNMRRSFAIDSANEYRNEDKTRIKKDVLRNWRGTSEIEIRVAIMKRLEEMGYKIHDDLD